MNPAKILIIYFYNQYPPFKSTWDNLYSLSKYSRHSCTYLNLAARNITPFLLKRKFDLILFHDMFLSRRWRPEQFAQLLRKIEPLKKISAIKAVTVQDEYFRSDDFNDFINNFEIDFVFSLAPESLHKQIYNKIDHHKVKIFKILTGYLDQHTIEKINKITKKKPHKNIAIGYRAVAAPPCWGRHGYLKFQIGQIFQQAALRADIKTDISTNKADSFLGDSWYHFLAGCKYTIGVEGGSGVMDRDGTIGSKTIAYLQKYPKATFEECEARCFKDMDGNIDYFSLSPRHLEACATKTCQILVEGEYNGILKPWKHYIPLKKDFSNIEEILKMVKDDHLREKITEQAYSDMVLSGKYSFQNFVEYFFSKTLPAWTQKTPFNFSFKNLFEQVYDRTLDSVGWLWIAFSWKLWRKAKHDREKLQLQKSG